MSRPPQLSAEQEAEAQRIFQILKGTTDDDLLALARLLAAGTSLSLLSALRSWSSSLGRNARTD